MMPADWIFLLPWLLFGLLSVLIVVGVPIAMAYLVQPNLPRPAADHLGALPAHVQRHGLIRATSRSALSAGR